MKLLFASVIQQHAGWGAEWFLNKGFNKLGIETINIDYRKNKKKLYNLFFNQNSFDYFFLQRGDHFPLDIIKSINRPKAFWATELVSRRTDFHHLLKSNVFDLYFVRSIGCKDLIIKNNWISDKKIVVLTSGFDEEIYFPQKKVKKDIDISFVGTLTERRKKIINKISQTHAIKTFNVFKDELNNIINRSKIVLNIHAEEFIDTETRVFESLGAGAFLISEPQSGESPFVAGKDYICCEKSSEIIDTIDYFLKNENKRTEIAKNGYLKAISGHTYTWRAKTIIKNLEKIGSINKSYSPINRRKIFIQTFKNKFL